MQWSIEVRCRRGRRAGIRREEFTAKSEDQDVAHARAVSPRPSFTVSRRILGECISLYVRVRTTPQSQDNSIGILKV